MRRRSLTKLLALGAAFSAAPVLARNAGQAGPGSEAGNKRLFRQVAHELFGNKDLSAIDRFYAVDYVQHVPERAERARREGIDAREETRRTLGALFTAFPDLALTIEQLCAEGDRVFALMTLRGTHRGDFFGIAPTGREVEMRAADVFRIVDGKLAEHWDVVDNSRLVETLGLARCPPPAPSGTAGERG